MKLELLMTLPHLWIGYLLAMCQSQQGHTTSLGGESRPASGNGLVETLQLHSQLTFLSSRCLSMGLPCARAGWSLGAE